MKKYTDVKPDVKKLKLGDENFLKKYIYGFYLRHHHR